MIASGMKQAAKATRSVIVVYVPTRRKGLAAQTQTGLALVHSRHIFDGQAVSLPIAIGRVNPRTIFGASLCEEFCPTRRKRAQRAGLTQRKAMRERLWLPQNSELMRRKFAPLLRSPNFSFGLSRVLPAFACHTYSGAMLRGKLSPLVPRAHFCPCFGRVLPTPADYGHNVGCERQRKRRKSAEVESLRSA